MKSKPPACFCISSVPRDDDFVCSEAECVLLLFGGSREDDNLGSERMGKFHAHVTQSAETGHANFLALGDTPVAHGRVSCDSGRAKEQLRRGQGSRGRAAQTS